MKTLTQLLSEFPPCLVRMAARGGRRQPLTDAQIASRAGRKRGEVVRWGRLESWATMTVVDVDDFLKGCGYSYGELAELRRYIRRTLDSATPFAHLNHLKPETISSIARACERAGAGQKTGSSGRPSSASSG